MRKRKTAIIIGCGRLGSMLAGDLSSRGCGVTVIDKSPRAFDRLDDRFEGYTVTADGTRAAVLKSCGITNANIVVACTDSDSGNILAAEIASELFSVENVYARLDDDEKASLLAPYNIESICPHRLCLSRFLSLEGLLPGETIA